MVRIEDLMALGITRRKAHDLAVQLGFGKADEYPDAVLPAVQAALAAERRAEPSASFSSAHSAAADEYAADAQEDLQYVQEAAENRAAGLLVALDTLTLYHCATRNFRNKALQRQVNESRQRVKQVLAGVAAYYEPNHFLAQTPLGQLLAATGAATGGNGSTNSKPSLTNTGSASELPDAAAK